MKKILMLAAVFCLMLTAAGCGDQKETSEESSAVSSSVSSETPAPESSEEKSSEPESKPAPAEQAEGGPETVYALPASGSAPSYEEITPTFGLYVPSWDGVSFSCDGEFELETGKYTVLQMMIGDTQPMPFYVSEDGRIYILANNGDLQRVSIPDVQEAYQTQYFDALDMMVGGQMGWNIDSEDDGYQPDPEQDPCYPSLYEQFSTAAEFEAYLQTIFTPAGMEKVLENTRYFDHDGKLYLSAGARGSMMDYAFHCYGPAIAEGDTITFPMYIYSYDLDGEGMEATGLSLNEFACENAAYVLKKIDGKWLVDSFSMPF